jgi:hypothetical protein
MSTPDGLPPNLTQVLLRNLLDRNGTAALLRVFAGLTLFLVLHLIRIPLVLVSRVLEGVMARVDRYTLAQVSRSPRGPINYYFPTGQEARGYA